MDYYQQSLEGNRAHTHPSNIVTFVESVYNLAVQSVLHSRRRAELTLRI